jgi:cytochrome d ubiquinol oxidase subunit II
MSALDGLAVVLLLGLAAYAVLGGADFGAGLWDLSRDRAQRELVVRAVGPVWEANHVWLIFVVITLFTGFPGAFGALSSALAGPLSVALLGIVLRGAAFVFRQYGAPYGGRPVLGTALWGRVFAVASLATPFAFGAAAGGLAAGAARPDGSAGLWRPFLAPLPLVAGLLAVSCCAYLAAVFLSRDAERIGSAALVSRLRRRALGAGVVSGGLALAALPLLPAGVAGELAGVGLPAVAVSVSGGVLGVLLLLRRCYRLARVAAALAPVGLLVGWAVALHPWVLPGVTRLADAAAPPAIAGTVLVALLAGLAVVAPGYVLMLRVLRALPQPVAAAGISSGE